MDSISRLLIQEARTHSRLLGRLQSPRFLAAADFLRNRCEEFEAGRLEAEDLRAAIIAIREVR